MTSTVAAGRAEWLSRLERDRDVIADVVQIEGIQVPAIFDVVDDEDSSRIGVTLRARGGGEGHRRRVSQGEPASARAARAIVQHVHGARPDAARCRAAREPRPRECWPRRQPRA